MHSFRCLFYSWQLRKRHQKWCTWKFFWPFLFWNNFSCVKNLDAPSKIISLKLSRHRFNFCLTFIFWSKSVIGIFPVVPPSTICSLLHKLCSKVKKSKIHFLSKSTSLNNWTDRALSILYLLFQTYCMCAIISSDLYFLTPFFTAANIVERLILQSG